MTKKNKNLSNFIKYFIDFYSEGGVIPIGFVFSVEDIITAIANYSFRKPDHKFEGDSIDREIIKVEMMYLKGLINDDDSYYKNPIGSI